MSAGLQRTAQLDSLGQSTAAVRRAKTTGTAASAFQEAGAAFANRRATEFGFGDVAASSAPAETNIGWTTLIWVNSWPCESIFGVAVGVNLLHNTRPPKHVAQDGEPHTWRAIIFEDLVVYGPYWALLYAAMFGQTMIIIFVKQIVDELDTSCKDTSYLLQLVTLMVWSALIWTDLWESFKMALYIRWLPVLDPGVEWDLGITEVRLDESGEVADFARDDGKTHGIYRRTQYLLHLFVILPKVAIAMGLWWYGCTFLLASDNDADLLLNSVALAFVLEIDEMIAKLVPESAREQVAKFPDFELQAAEWYRNFIPSREDPSKNMNGGPLRRKDLWCSGENLKDPYFFWSTYGHWIPPIIIFGGVFCAQEIICIEENK